MTPITAQRAKAAKIRHVGNDYIVLDLSCTALKEAPSWQAMKTTKAVFGMLTIAAALAASNSQGQITVRVPLDQPTIQGAINAAGVGGTVLVSDGKYTEHDITITNPVNVVSVNGRDKTTIDAQSLGRVCAVNSASNGWVRIEGFTLTAGYAPRPLEDCGVAWQAGFLEVSNCIIQNCTGSTIAAGNASGLAYWDNIRFTDCIVRSNSVENYGGLGGATVVRCVLYGNSGWNQTAVLLACDSYNCTVANNAAGFLPNAWTTGGMVNGRAVNCILWGNDGNNGQQVYQPDSVTYSIVQGGYAGTGNLDSDPLFVNATNGDFHLQVNSPAINAGDPSRLDPDGTRSDMGAFPLYFLFPCDPHSATATATLDNGFVVGATLTDGGCGYTNTPIVLIQGGGGTGGAATAVVSNGVVVGITITDAGIGYTNTPTLYIYPPFGVQVSLIKAVKPAFSGLLLSTNYQLQVSADLSTWTNQGSAFTATNTSMVYPQYWDVDNWSQLFFRIQVAP